MIKKCLLLFVIVGGFALQGWGQSVDWAWWAQEDSVFLSQNSNRTLDTDVDGNFAVTFYSLKKNNFTAFGGTVPIGNKGNWIKSGLIKFDTKGNYLWSFIGHTDTNNTFSNQTFRTIGVVSKDNYYYAICMAGVGKTKLYKDNLLLDSFNYTGYSSPYVVIKLDSSAKIQWIREIYASRAYPTKHPSRLQFINGSVETYEKGISFSMTMQDSAYIATNSTGYTSIKHNQPTCFGNVIANGAINLFYDTAGFLDTVVSLNSDLYFYNGANEKSGSTIFGTTLCDSTTFAGVKFYRNEGNYFRLDNSFTPSPLIRVKNGVRPILYLGSYRSFASFTPGFNQSSNQRISDTLESFVDSAIYRLDTGEMMVFNQNYKLLFRKKVFNYKASDSVRFNIGRHHIDSNVIYLFGVGSNLSTTTKNILFNGISYSLPKNSTFSFLFKMDEYLNVLWLRIDSVVSSSAVLTQIRDMTVDKNRDIIFVGYMGPNNSSDFFDQTLPSQSFQYNFVIKLRDQTITRGNVYPGPYCSGDSLKIPYKAEGNFDTANYFIAQLSDENGNFDDTSKIEELGRLKQTKDDTIKSILPLYQLNTSAAYRIRIISTSPPVQSYYKIDTLRLLIYSKDTANAGPDLTICKGQKIQLDTRGGSKWQWTPGGTFITASDSAKRNPFVAPFDTTQYRIIISDSSGCGLTDTDYVKVNVRPYITHVFKAETTVCKGYTQTLKSQPMGGDSTKYWYKWRERTSLDIISVTDSLIINPVKTTSYIVTVGDSCSNKIIMDTVMVQVDTVLNAYAGVDTTICKGKSAVLNAYGSGCNPKYYKYEWREKGKTTVLATAATYTASPASTTEYVLTLKDTSTTLVSNDTVKVTVDNIFIANVTKDTTICKGQSLVLEAGAVSCDTSQLGFVWNNGLDTTKTNTVTPNITTTYTVIVTNKFNGLKDTASVTVTVRPPLKVTVNADTTICLGQSAELRAVASGGYVPSHSILWTADPPVGGWTANTSQTTVSPQKTTTYRAVLTDNCTLLADSAEIKITVRDSLKITVNADTTICVGESAELRATAIGGNTPSRSVLWTVVGGPWTNSSPIVAVNPTTTTTYRAVLSDACTSPNDSAEVTITVRPPLKVTVNGQTNACVGDTVILTAQATGGDSTNYNYLWKLPDNSTQTTPSISVKPTTTSSYTIIVGDNCSTPGFDSVIHTINIPTPISISTNNDTTICDGWSVPLSVTITGGVPANYKTIWEELSSGFRDTNSAIVVKPTSNTQYSISVGDNCSFPKKDTVNITVLPSPKADFSLQNNIGCEPLLVIPQDLSQNHDTLFNVWKTNATLKEGKQPPLYYPQAGIYDVALVVKNTLGCADSINKTGAVVVYPKPIANFTVNPAIKQVEEEITFNNLSSGAINYTWFLGENDSILIQDKSSITKIYKDTGNYQIQLIAKTQNKCEDTAISYITLVDLFTIVIPNAFTPNGDFLNDIFTPVNTGTLAYKMTFFNRWGEVIYYCECSSGCSNPCTWDGNYRGIPLPEGTYSYILTLEAQTRTKRTIMGSVVLIR